MIRVSLRGDERLRRKLKGFSRQVGAKQRAVYYDAMATWCNLNIMYFPPFPDGNPAKGNSVAARKTGERAVVSGMNTQFFAGHGPDALISAGILDMHARSKDKRGRVRHTGTRIAAKHKDLLRAIKQVKKHVGRLKAGWLRAGEYYARKAGRQVRAPAWVKRHGSAGTKSDKMSAAGRGHIEATNNQPGASNYQRQVDFTQKLAQRYLEKATKARMAKLADAFNKGGGA